MLSFQIEIVDACLETAFTIDPSIISPNPIVYDKMGSPEIRVQLLKSDVIQTNPHITDTAVLSIFCPDIEFILTWYENSPFIATFPDIIQIDNDASPVELLITCFSLTGIGRASLNGYPLKLHVKYVG